VYVHEDDHDKLVEHLTEEAKRATVGDGMNPATTHGPLNNKAQLDIVRKYVEDARSRGATIVIGGHQVGNPNGFGYAPTIVTNVDETFNLVREEQFGPALPIIKYKTLDDAVEQANDSSVGLGASVWGHNTKEASAIASLLQSGTCWVNQHKVMTPNTPFGGFKESGIGRENGLGGLMNFLEPQVCNVAKVSWAKL
jgi:acyl-CoA reductase-like NAD-dependent aldehyde dehydrogenase